MRFDAPNAFCPLTSHDKRQQYGIQLWNTTCYSFLYTLSVGHSWMWWTTPSVDKIIWRRTGRKHLHVSMECRERSISSFLFADDLADLQTSSSKNESLTVTPLYITTIPTFSHIREHDFFMIHVFGVRNVVTSRQGSEITYEFWVF